MSRNFMLDTVSNTCYRAHRFEELGKFCGTMNCVPAFGCGVLGCATVFLLMPLVLRYSQQLPITPRRDLHHTHDHQVPRLGGIALVGAFLAVECLVAVLFPAERARIPGRSVVMWSSLAIFALGLADDLHPLGAKRKLAGQVLVALAVHLAGFGVEALKLPFSGRIVELHLWGVVLTVLWLVSITNLLNLIDGVDGLAGGIALMLMSLLVYVGATNGTFVLLTAGMSGALLGFLYFNFPPARVYLGDGGAYFLGFQIGLFALIGSHKGTIAAALVAPLFVLALPIVDTSLAVARRGLRGLPLFRPDRRHIHHHLLGMGLSRRRVLLYLYCITLVFLAMGFAAFWSDGQLVPILLGVAVVLLLVCAGRLRFSRRWFAVGPTLGHSLAMRQEVQYALSLVSWLRCEGRRSGSVEELYHDLTFAAGRLGFSYVKLRLADEERSWERFAGAASADAIRQQIQMGDFGALEVGAARRRRADQVTALFRDERLSLAADRRLFELLAELLAEGWLKAARAGFGSCPLRFTTRSPRFIEQPDGCNRQHLLPQLVAAPVAKSLSMDGGSNGICGRLEVTNS